MTTLQIHACATSYLLVLVAKAMLIPLPYLKRLGWTGPTSKIASSSLVTAGTASTGKQAVSLPANTHTCPSHRELARWFHLKKSKAQSHLLSCPGDHELDFLSTGKNWISQCRQRMCAPSLEITGPDGGKRTGNNSITWFSCGQTFPACVAVTLPLWDKCQPNSY